MPDAPRVGFVLVAAGASQRMGTAKQLLPYDGVPLVRRAASHALASGCAPVVVVVGARGDAVTAALDGLPVTVAVNPRWAEGVGTSIHAGLAALARCPDIEGVVLGLADQPFVTAPVVERLVTRWRRSGKAIAASRYAGTVGVPACFSPAGLPWLAALSPDQGCKRVILEHLDDAVLEDCPEAVADVDTPGEYELLIGARVETRVLP